jgi:UDP-glucose 4-epimerase
VTVLVTGGAGYIGSQMVLNLLDAGESVVVVDNLSTGLRRSVPDAARLFVADIGDAEAMRSLIVAEEISAILHFAGSIVVPESITDPLGYYLNNTVNSRALMEAAVTCGVRHFIFSSTAAVYGTPKLSPVSEDAELKPISPYGSSKLMTETMLRDVAAAHGLSYVILRYFNVAGADPERRTGQSTPLATHLIKVACQAALGLRPGIEIYGSDYPTRDGTCIRDYIHVADLTDAHLLALKHLRAGGENLVLNCGYGHGHSVLEVIEAVRRVAGVEFPVHMAARRPGDPAALVSQAQRLRNLLDWRPAHDSLPDIVSDALEWERIATVRTLRRL